MDMETVHPLKTYRVGARLTQLKLAELLDVTRTTIARWESGTRKIDEDRLMAVSEKTGISKTDLRPDLAALMREAAE